MSKRSTRRSWTAHWQRMQSCVLNQGMTLRDGTECKSAKLEILETEPELRVHVTLKEGKYHQVKRMIAAVGGTVTALKRLRLGGLWLDKILRARRISGTDTGGIGKTYLANLEKLKKSTNFLSFLYKNARTCDIMT